MSYTKKAVAVAVTSALGMGAVQAASIVSMTIEDTDGGGVSGAFAFGGPGSTTYSNFFDSTSSVTFTPTFGSPVVVTPSSDIIAGAGQGSAVFSAGFIFSGGPFLPASLNGTSIGSNTTTPDGIAGTVVSGSNGDPAAFSEFHWGGQFGPEYFPLSPVSFNVNSWSQGTGGGLCATGTTSVCYDLEWDALIAPQGGFAGPTNWALQGVATLDVAVTLASSAVPVPAAAWLFGSGLLGLVGVARRRNK